MIHILLVLKITNTEHTGIGNWHWYCYHTLSGKSGIDSSLVVFLVFFLQSLTSSDDR